MRIEIRTLKQRIHASLRAHIVRRFFYALGPFGDRVRSVLLRIEDLNGPRGGLDKRCQAEVKLAGGGSLIVDVRDVELEPAIARTANRLRRRIRDELNVRRKFRKRGRAALAGPAFA